MIAAGSTARDLDLASSRGRRLPVDLDLRLVRSFLVVAEELNITRASQRLHLAQQAVSVQMQQLERTLGVPLLVRTSRGVQLTPAGRELAVLGEHILSHTQATIDRVRAVAHGETGRLRLACVPYAATDFALEVVTAVEHTVPDVEMALVTVSTPDEVLEALRGREVDAGLLWAPVEDPALQVATVRTERRMVALPLTHPLASRSSLNLADLADEPVIVPRTTTSAATLAHALAEPRPDGRPARRGPAADRAEDQLLLVARGRGIWLASEPVSRYFSNPHVRWLDVTDAEPSVLALAWTRQAPAALVSRLLAEARAITGWSPSAANP